ncbi:RHS repeat domain-containing protein, partial [Xanthomonas vasicola]
QARRAGAVTMNYRYNGKGEQVRRFLGTTNTYTLYDEAGHWLGDYDSNGAPKQQAIWLDDLPVGLLANANKLHYIEPDHLGSPRVVIDPTRDVPVWTWSLKGEAFGNTAPNQDPDGDGAALVLDMRFPGQRFDAASGLNQNYFRDYEATTGRYGQSDPLGLQGGISTHGYALGSPLSLTDPLGLAPNPACAAGWIAACSVVGGGVGYWGGGILGGVAGSEVPIAGNAAGFVAGSQLGGMGGASAGGILGGLTAGMACPDEKPCPPCKTISGMIVPVGTIGYRPLDVIPNNVMQHGVYGSHHNIFVANQYPYPKCDCFWAKQKYVVKPDQLQPGWVPVEPFVTDRGNP